MGKDWDKLEGDMPPGYSETPRWHDVGWQGFKRLPNFFVAGPKAQSFHQTWLEQCFRVLAPGGIIKSFGGSRTFHRVAAAMGDVGFEVVDLEAWVYASGFPKGLNVAKALDAYIRTGKSDSKQTGTGARDRKGLHWSEFPRSRRVNEKWEPEYEDAVPWIGWGTALKPSWEPVVVGRKPGGSHEFTG